MAKFHSSGTYDDTANVCELNVDGSAQVIVQVCGAVAVRFGVDGDPGWDESAVIGWPDPTMHNSVTTMSQQA